MSEKMFEYSKGKFVNPKKIIAANAYLKDNQYRVAIDCDTTSKEKATLYSDVFANYEGAEAYIKTIPC